MGMILQADSAAWLFLAFSARKVVANHYIRIRDEESP
jgi:hypothetical protein